MAFINNNNLQDFFLETKLYINTEVLKKKTNKKAYFQIQKHLSLHLRLQAQ